MQVKKDLLSAYLMFLIVVVFLGGLSGPEATPIDDALIFVSDFDPVDASRLSNSVYRVGLDGGELRHIAGSIRHPDLGFIRIADIDCDGATQSLVMASHRRDLNGFYHALLDGSGLHLDKPAAGDLLSASRQIALAPDGLRIIVSREYPGFSQARYGLVAGDLGSREYASIKTPTAERSYLAPDWSPDGLRIAYVIEWRAPDARGRFAITVADVDGAQERIIHETSLVIEDIDWSPDGEWIAASIGRQVYRLRGDGGDIRRLTQQHNGARSPRWSPDGRQISFAAGSTFPGQNQLMVMEADGSNLRRVAVMRGEVVNGCWV